MARVHRINTREFHQDVVAQLRLAGYSHYRAECSADMWTAKLIRMTQPKEWDRSKKTAPAVGSKMTEQAIASAYEGRSYGA